MKILAILALVATIAGAGAVLYGINTLRPQVVQTAASEMRAQDAADTFAALVSQLENNTFGGKIFGGTGDLRAEECAFVTYTVRLKNRGFFPAEWISMELLEPAVGMWRMWSAAMCWPCRTTADTRSRQEAWAICS